MSLSFRIKTFSLILIKANRWLRDKLCYSFLINQKNQDINQWEAFGQHEYVRPDIKHKNNFLFTRTTQYNYSLLMRSIYVFIDLMRINWLRRLYFHQFYKTTDWPHQKATIVLYLHKNGKFLKYNIQIENTNIKDKKFPTFTSFIWIIMREREREKGV